MDPSGVAMVNGRVLFFPIVYGYSEQIDEVFLTDEYYKKMREEAEAVEEEPDSKYDYRNFRLELLPDCKTAIILYSCHITYKEKPSSGGSSHHHHHDN